jgi:hypothetical protein
VANCVGGWECVYKRYECELFISNAADLGTNTKVASLLNQRTVGNCGLDIAIQKLTLDFMMGRFGSPSDVSSRHKRATRTLFAFIHTLLTKLKLRTFLSFAIYGLCLQPCTVSQPTRLT